MIFQYTETYTQCSRFRIYSFQHRSLSCFLPKVSVQDVQDQTKLAANPDLQSMTHEPTACFPCNGTQLFEPLTNITVRV